MARLFCLTGDFSKAGWGCPSPWALTIPGLGLPHAWRSRTMLAQEKEGQDEGEHGGRSVWGVVSTHPKLSCGRPGPVAQSSRPLVLGSAGTQTPPLSALPAHLLCRARILFLLQLLADRVPGVGLVASKCGMGRNDY